jgi:hypothetical protein
MCHSLTFLAVLLLPVSFALAQNDAAPPPNLITDHAAVLFVRLDLTKLQPQQVETILKSRLDQPEFDRHTRAVLDRLSAQLTTRLDQLKRAGVQEMYVVGSLEFLEFDLTPLLESPQDFAYFVVPHTNRLDSAAIAKAFDVQINDTPQATNRIEVRTQSRRWMATEADFSGKRFTLIGPQRIVSTASQEWKNPRPEVVAALHGDAPLQIALVPPPIFGRAFSEIIGPALGGQTDATKAMSAFQSASLGIDPKPDGQWRFTIQARDPASATSLQSLLQALPMTVPQLTTQPPLIALATLFGSLELKTDGAQAIAQGRLNERGSAEQALRTVLSQGLLAVARQQTARKMRQIVIGINNHIDSYKTLPMSAGFSTKDGKPLLSWRVKLLLYVEEGNLYREFRKDEPWDSEHNKKLIDRMPEIYRRAYGDPKSTKTPFVLPVGKHTAYPGGRELTISEIHDGVSKTVALLSVAPEHEVVWTKPDDWEVDWDDPSKGLDYLGDSTIAAFLDAHTKALPKTASQELWRRILGAADGLIVEFDSP